MQASEQVPAVASKQASNHENAKRSKQVDVCCILARVQHCYAVSTTWDSIKLALQCCVGASHDRTICSCLQRFGQEFGKSAQEKEETGAATTSILSQLSGRMASPGDATPVKSLTKLMAMGSGLPALPKRSWSKCDRL